MTVGELYLVVILIAVYVCTLAIQGATVRLMFSMGRDRRLPLGGAWGQVNTTFKTPANAAIAVGVLAAIPFFVTGAGAAIYIAIAATGMIYISYFLCNLGVLVARRRGWPHQGAWFKLGSWGTIINILALVWGGLMVINIALWTDPNLFGVFGNDLRNTWSNPFINTFIKIGGQVQDRLAGLADLRDLVGAVVVVGALYYLVAQRGSSTRSRSRPTRRPARPPSASDATDPAIRRATGPGRCAGSCATSSSGRCSASRSSPGRELTPDAPCRAGSRTATSCGRSPARSERWVIRLAGNDTHLLGISREVEHAATVAAAGVGVGPEVTAFIRPEGYLVTRFIEGSPVVGRGGPSSRRRSGESPIRSGGSTTARPSRACSCRSGSSRRTGRWPWPAASRSRPSTTWRRPSAGGSSCALLAAPIELRPCHNDLLNANFIDDGTRIRIVDWEYAGMGDPFFDLGNFSINHELTADEDADPARGVRRARSARPGSPG